ncbi:MarR family transcriptional regulator [Nocardia brasiliensis]|uniref:MarR family transcriptional regulator n=1 Tax=Nocardia brasiliensis TaxID=37326 RepID=UPI002457A59C|nr:MarR family transcriptional regulator [Nocardia brasiliensis]
MSEKRLAHAEVAVLAYLLGNPTPQRQVHIAAATGVTQARISQILTAADAKGWTERSADGWQVRRPRELFDRLVAARAPRQEAVEAWYSLDSAQRQIELVLEQATAQHVSVRVCGDWAADLVAPWRIPDIVLIHADSRLDLESAGFVRVETDPSDATLVVSVGAISPGWHLDSRLAAAMGGPRDLAWPLAPVIEVARHILTVGGPDALDAVAELEQRFLSARADLEVSSCTS